MTVGVPHSVKKWVHHNPEVPSIGIGKLNNSDVVMAKASREFVGNEGSAVDPTAQVPQRLPDFDALLFPVSFDVLSDLRNVPIRDEVRPNILE